MSDLLAAIAEDAAIGTPDQPLPIALVGAGAIVEHAHIPAYRAAQLPAPTRVADNIETLALVEALYRSIDSGEAEPVVLTRT